MCFIGIVMHGRSICRFCAENAGVASGFTCRTRPHATRQLLVESKAHALDIQLLSLRTYFVRYCGCLESSNSFDKKTYNILCSIHYLHPAATR